LLFALRSSLFAQAAEKPFTLLTDELLAKLPEAPRAVWTAYIDKSRAFAANEHRLLDAERAKAEAKPAPGNRAEFESVENQKLAEVVISYQTPTGGWSKAVDYTKGPRQPGTHWTAQKGDA
jgi:thioesterase domain-containing protein